MTEKCYHGEQFHDIIGLGEDDLGEFVVKECRICFETWDEYEVDIDI